MAKEPDWTPEGIARSVMDLWQEHLTAYADDTRMRDDLTRMTEPFAQLFAVWSTMMQDQAHDPARKPGPNAAPRGATAQRPAPAAATSADGGNAMDELATRLGALEERLAGLEHKLERRRKPRKPAGSACAARGGKQTS